ncbi:MAG TPA: GNAT family N-acetyltransferase [Candidatus Limnocylindrales bacterium]|nr:GNAT family N-acetyltransferase [Candidatus Limnocylindrales bacterium]
MERVDIIALQQDHLPEAVETFLEAFKEEAFTVAWLDLSRQKVRDAYNQAVRLMMQLYLEVGQPMFAVLKENEVIGLAILKSPHVAFSKSLIFWRIIPRLPVLARLLPYYLRATLLMAAVSPPANLPGKYYTLEILAVHPDHQGEGLGRMMLEYVDQICANDPAASGIYLVTGDEKNKIIYEHFSYQVLEVRATRSINAYHMFSSLPR